MLIDAIISAFSHSFTLKWNFTLAVRAAAVKHNKLRLTRFSSDCRVYAPVHIQVVYAIFIFKKTPSNSDWENETIGKRKTFRFSWAFPHKRLCSPLKREKSSSKKKKKNAKAAINLITCASILLFISTIAHSTSTSSLSVGIIFILIEPNLSRIIAYWRRNQSCIDFLMLTWNPIFRLLTMSASVRRNDVGDGWS